jgi:hypothetical protein
MAYEVSVVKPTKTAHTASRSIEKLSMTQPSPSVQQMLCGTLLQMLQSPDLTPEDREWLRHFATSMIAEFNVLKSKHEEDEPEEPAAA